jgi:hypothetical protein
MRLIRRIVEFSISTSKDCAHYRGVDRARLVLENIGDTRVAW